uniref:THAP-type domain-containing protein n=1 Tax=Micrurus carvalhoi TaxID=3147026 RepID=A0A2H6NG22_9SAUR
MTKCCRAPRCSNSAGQPRRDQRRLSFYKFPLHSPERLRQWLSQMNQEEWAPTKHQHLCSDHFAPSCFEYRWGVRYLKPDAVPTIFQTSDSPLVRIPLLFLHGLGFKSPFVKLENYSDV